MNGSSSLNKSNNKGIGQMPYPSHILIGEIPLLTVPYTEWGDSESEMTIGPSVHAPVRILDLLLLLCQDPGKSLHLQ